LQPGHRFSVRHGTRLSGRMQRPRTPCAHRLGERTERQRLGRAIVAPSRGPTASNAAVPHWPVPGPCIPRAGLAPAELRTPRAFHGLDCSMFGPTGSLEHLPPRGLLRPCGLCLPGGPAPALRPLPAQHPCHEGSDRLVPFRTYWPSPRSTSCPREALRLSSVTAPRCFESASTTDVLVTSTRDKHPLWGLAA